MSRILLATIGVTLLAGCRKDVELLPRLGPGLDMHTADGAAMCSGLGDPIRLDNGSSQCAAVLAAQAHRYALCSCGALTLEQQLASDALDSTGLTAGSQVTAALAGNAGLLASADLTLGGALHISGGDLTGAGKLRISESLRAGGSLAAATDIQVSTDAFVASDALGSLTVAGTLHIPSSATVGTSVSAGTVVREAVAIAPPCPCLPASFVDVAKAITLAATTNRNAAIGLRTDALSGGASLTTLDLPCGTFFVSAINPAAALTINVRGHSALAVMGDVSLASALVVQLDAGAELDLIVGGTLTASGGHDLGNLTAPARVRIWIGGNSTVLLDGDPAVGAVVNASRAQLSAPSGLELFGSVLAQSYSLGGATTLHYDRAILSGGAVCGMPAQPAVH